MKKLMLSVVICGSALLVACDSVSNSQEQQQQEEQQQQSPEHLIIGKWNPAQWVISYTADDKLVERDGNTNANRIFESDGTGYESYNFGHDGKDDWQPLYRFKWSLADNKISFSDVKFTPPEGIVFGQGEWAFETEWLVVELSSKEMKVEFSRKSLMGPVERFDNSVIFQK